MEAALTHQSWESAFEHNTIANVRTIEKQLRASILNDKGKLRGLVGNNYRELLASAEQIVLLEAKTKEVETLITQIGQHCQPPTHIVHAGQHDARTSRTGRLRFLQRCLAAGRTALQAADVLQSSQLAVIARLLLRSLAEDGFGQVNSFREKLTLLRKNLLRRIDTALVSPSSDLPALVQSCCAYCLISSASSTDALKHFQSLRSEKLRSMLSNEALTQIGFLRAVRYQLNSLQSLNDLAGRPLIEALGSMQKRPILDDPHLLKLELLDVQSMRPLLPEDVKSFMPYLKRSPLAAAESRSMLQTWSEETSHLMSDGAKQYLQAVYDYSEVLQFRQSIYKILLPTYFATTAGAALHELLQDVLSSRIQAIIEATVNELSIIGNNLRSSALSQSTVESLWHPELAQTPLSDGGRSLLQQVRRRRLGRNARQVKDAKSLKAWLATIQAMRQGLDDVRRHRWRDILEEPGEEQEEQGNELVENLTQRNADSYLEILQRSFNETLANFVESLVDAASDHTRAEDDRSQLPGLIRVIRDSLDLLRQAFPEAQQYRKLSDALPQLYAALASTVVERLRRWAANQPDRVQAKETLPDLPSPRTFQVLQQLCTILTEIGGTDLWTAPALRPVRDAAAVLVFSDRGMQDYIETNFDEAYLRCALRQPKLEEIPATDAKMKAAEGYWSRTRLLFGILDT